MSKHKTTRNDILSFVTQRKKRFPCYLGMIVSVLSQISLRHLLFIVILQRFNVLRHSFNLHHFGLSQFPFCICWQFPCFIHLCLGHLHIRPRCDGRMLSTWAHRLQKHTVIYLQKDSKISFKHSQVFQNKLCSWRSFPFPSSAFGFAQRRVEWHQMVHTHHLKCNTDSGWMRTATPWKARQGWFTAENLFFSSYRSHWKMPRHCNNSVTRP